MNTVASWIKYLRIRRPFSRKIHLRTDHVLMESGSSEFLAEYGPLQRKFPLVAAIAALALAYRGDYDNCHALIKDIIKRGFKPELSRLYLKSDLR